MPYCIDIVSSLVHMIMIVCRVKHQPLISTITSTSPDIILWVWYPRPVPFCHLFCPRHPLIAGSNDYCIITGKPTTSPTDILTKSVYKQWTDLKLAQIFFQKFFFSDKISKIYLTEFCIQPWNGAIAEIEILLYWCNLFDWLHKGYHFLFVCTNLCTDILKMK